MGWKGWTYEPMPTREDLADYVKKRLTWETGKHKIECLDVAIVTEPSMYDIYLVAYASVKSTKKKNADEHVWAAVVLLDLAGDKLGVKEMSEYTSPEHYQCPERILNQLMPTDDRYAQHWRNMCRHKIDLRPSWTKQLGWDENGNCLSCGNSVGNCRCKHPKKTLHSHDEPACCDKEAQLIDFTERWRHRQLERELKKAEAE